MSTCLVIGAGPAGLATAIGLKQLGWQVTVVERRNQIEQKVCGELLSPPSKNLLARLGVTIPSIHIKNAPKSAIIGRSGTEFVLDFGSEPPFTVSRFILDSRLFERASEVGVKFRFGTPVVDLKKDVPGYRAYLGTGELLRCDLLVGADGRQSWVARQTGLAHEEGRRLLKKSAIMAFFEMTQSLDRIEMHTAAWGYVGLNPLPNGTLNITAVLDSEELKARLKGGGVSGLGPLFRELTSGRSAPLRLRELMKSCKPVSEKIWSVSPLAWTPQRIADFDCALVGDSAGFIDPFTGEGLFHALVTASELISMLEIFPPAIALKNYESWHVHRFKSKQRFCLLLQKVLARPWLTECLIWRLRKSQKLSHSVAEVVADRDSANRILNPRFLSKLILPLSEVWL